GLRRFLSVSIGRRGSPDGPFGSAHQVHCQRASHPKPCRGFTQAAYPSYHHSSMALSGNSSISKQAHPDVIGQSCGHCWGAWIPEMLSVTQLLMRPTDIVGTSDQIHSRPQARETLGVMP